MNLEAIAKGLDRMEEIMREPSVTAMRGLAYTDRDTRELAEARHALENLEFPAETHAAQALNRKYLKDIHRGAETAHYLLGRIGFNEVRGVAFVDRDQRIVDAGYEAAKEMTSGRAR